MADSDIQTPETIERQTGDATQPPATPARKRADHPHQWTIALGVIAIIISCLSWLESHASRIINERVSSAMVEVSGIQLAEPDKPFEPGDLPMIRVTITNLGKSPATKISLWSLIAHAPINPAKSGNESREQIIGSLGAGASRLANVNGVCSYEDEGSLDSNTLYFYVYTTFVDELTGATKERPVSCFLTSITSKGSLAEPTTCSN